MNQCGFQSQRDCLTKPKVGTRSGVTLGYGRGWRVHAWVMMGNHFHLLLETPEANLVAGMKWFMGVFSQRWNRRRKRLGHVFQGRYKAVVNGEGAAGLIQNIPEGFGTVAGGSTTGLSRLPVQHPGGAP